MNGRATRLDGRQTVAGSYDQQWNHQQIKALHPHQLDLGDVDNGDLLMPKPGLGDVLAVDARSARQDAPVASAGDDGHGEQESDVCGGRESRRGTHRADQRHRSEPEERPDEHGRQSPDCH